MIAPLATPVNSILNESSSLACPVCKCSLYRNQEQSKFGCVCCGRCFPVVVGFPDLRVESDRYLMLNAERAKAVKLARIAESGDLRSVAEAYYAMTPDPDPVRCRAFLAHILRAERRGEALVSNLPTSGRLLEIGCGTGGLLLAAHRRGLNVTGIDIASRWLVAAHRRLKDAGVTVPLIAASGEALPVLDQTFDAVVADSVVEHLDKAGLLFSEALRVLRPGGQLHLWSPNRYSLMADPHVRLWGVGWMTRALGQKYTRFRRGDVWLPRCLDTRTVRKMAIEAGFARVQVGLPQVNSEVLGRTAGRCYQCIRKSRWASAVVAAVGPVWALSAEKPNRP